MKASAADGSGSDASTPTRPINRATGAAELGPPLARLDHLLGLAVSGDRDAFAEFYDATSSRMFSLALSLVRDRDQAEDITEAAYVQMWKTSRRFNPGHESAMTWGLMIVHRVAVNRLRSQQAQASGARSCRHQEHLNRTVPCSRSTITPSVETRQARATLSLLPFIQREALELASFGGHTYADVGELTGAPNETARIGGASWRFVARRMLAIESSNESSVGDER